MKLRSLIKLCLGVLSLTLCLGIAGVNIAQADNTDSELKAKFQSFGGSDMGFDKILTAVNQTQAKAQQLQDHIDRYYNPQLSKIMSANNFNANAYGQVYSKLEQEKLALVKESLKSMVLLLQSLSASDRAAYAKLLFVNVKSLNMPAAPAVQPHKGAPTSSSTADINENSQNQPDNTNQGASESSSDNNG